MNFIRKSVQKSGVKKIFVAFAVATLTYMPIYVPAASASIASDYKIQNVQENEFTITNSTPYLIETAVLELELESNFTPQSAKIEILRETNTRSRLFSFERDFENIRTINSFEIDFSEQEIDTSGGLISLEIDVNNPDQVGLNFRSNGVYPLSVTLENENQSDTQYTFVTYVSSVNDEGQTYDAKLGVTPIIKYQPFVNRLALFNTKNQLSESGLNRFQKTIDTRNTIALLQRKNFNSTFILSPESIELSAILDRAANIEDEIQRLYFDDPSAGINYIADVYVPTNFAQIQNANFLNDFDRLITASSEVLDTHDYSTRIDDTLVTTAVRPQNVSELLDRGFTKLLVDKSSFPQNVQPSFNPVTLQEQDDSVTVATSDDSIFENLPDFLSDSAKANYLIAALSVVALEAPSLKRGYVVPFDLENLSAQTMEGIADGLINNPLLDSITLEQYFETYSPDANLSRRINRLNFGEVKKIGFNMQSLEKIKTASRAASSMFEENSTLYLNARWFGLVPLSDSNRKVSSIVNSNSAENLVQSSLEYIALPKSRTLTLTSRESTLPVTLRNTSLDPITVVVQVASNRLSFPEGSSVETVLTEENTTIQIPVIARTSGAFPITISIVTPDEDIEIIRTTATVRSTAFSGVGLAITIFSLLFLAFWWISHHRKTKKLPVAPVLSLKNEK